MAIRRGWVTAGAVAAAVVLLAGCGSGSDSAATTSATTAATTSSAATSEATTSEERTSAASVTSPVVSTPSPTTTVGGDTTTLDAQSTTWFDTMCSGMQPMTALVSGDIDSAESFNDAMNTAGKAFQDTGAQLGTIPPPTFEGGEEFAATTSAGFQDFGQTFIDIGQRALEVEDGDTAAQQQLLQDLQSEAVNSPVAQMQLTPQLAEAVQAIPSCQALFG